MRNRILSTLAAIAVLLGGGLAVAQFTGSASAAPVKAVAAPVLSTTQRGLCIKNGTGEPRSLWLVAATGLCPDPYWGPATLEQAFGEKVAAELAALRPSAPSGIVPVHKTVKLDADFQDGSVADRTVVISGLPAYKGSSLEAAGSNITSAANPLILGATTTVTNVSPGGDELPVLTTVKITPVVPSVGSTSRKFVVETFGFTGTRTFGLDLWVVPVS